MLALSNERRRSGEGGQAAMTDRIKRWAVTRTFEWPEEIARPMAYELAGEAFEIVNCGARIDRITLEPRQEPIWHQGALCEQDRRQVARWGRLARIKVEGTTTHDTVRELKEIAGDQEALSLGAEPAPMLINRWWSGITDLAE